MGQTASAPRSGPRVASFRNLEVASFRNLEVASFRNLEVASFRNLEVASFRNLEVASFRIPGGSSGIPGGSVRMMSQGV
jgi:hypothetical protein